MKPSVPHLAILLTIFLPVDRVDAENQGAPPPLLPPPTASDSTVAKPGPRVEILLSHEGEIFIHGTKFSPKQLTAIAATISKIDPEARVYLRADKSVAGHQVKQVVKACAAGGMNDFVFGSYTKADLKTLNAPGPDQ